MLELMLPAVIAGDAVLLLVLETALGDATVGEPVDTF